MKNLTRFTFIRDSLGRPAGCLAYRVNDGSMEYEVSTHNPVDEFNRKTARLVAEGRLNKHPRRLSFSATTPPKLDQLLHAAVLDLLQAPEQSRNKERRDVHSIPERLRKVLQLRVDFLESKKNDDYLRPTQTLGSRSSELFMGVSGATGPTGPTGPRGRNDYRYDDHDDHYFDPIQRDRSF